MQKNEKTSFNKLGMKKQSGLVIPFKKNGISFENIDFEDLTEEIKAGEEAFDTAYEQIMEIRRYLIKSKGKDSIKKGESIANAVIRYLSSED